MVHGATIVSNYHATSDLTTDRLQIDLEFKIALLDINQNPATFVINRLSTKRAKQPQVSWDTDEVRPFIDTIFFSTGYNTTATALTVANGEFFIIGDMWQVWDSFEMMRVQAAHVVDVVEFIRNFPDVASGETGFPTALVDGDFLYLVNQAQEEGAASPESVMTVEVQHDNFCQIDKNAYEISETEMASLFNTEATLPYETSKKAMEHQLGQERNFFWGIPSAGATGASGKPIRTSGGANWWIRENAPAANVVSQDDVTEDEFLEWVRNCFRYGSSEKWLFACPILFDGIQKWGLSKLETKTFDKQYGFAPTVWVTPHGTLNLVIHKQLEGVSPGVEPGYAFILDMNEINHRPLRTTHLITNIQAPDEDRRKNQYLTENTYTWGNFEKHGVLDGILTVSL